eukprot:s3285_g6.t1
MFPFYYNQRVVMSPKEYYDKMVKNEIGRADLDGICPYTGEDDEGNLLYPPDEAIREWFDQKASKVKWSDDMMFAGRPFECMKPTIDLLLKMEKMLAFLVEAGFNPERLQFLVPMSKMRGTNEEKAQMRQVISNFLARLLKGTFPDKKHYAYFRHVDEGFEEVIHFVPLIVYLIHHIKERSGEAPEAPDTVEVPDALPPQAGADSGAGSELIEAKEDVKSTSRGCEGDDTDGCDDHLDSEA